MNIEARVENPLNSRSNYYGLIFILSVIGAILFIFTEFGGYGGYYQYSVNLGSSLRNPDLIAYSPLLFLVAFLFLVNVFLSLKGLNIIKTSFPKNAAKLGFYSSLGILAITALGGIAFELLLSESGAKDWWFGSGFYAGIIGGILLPLLYRLVMKNPSTNLSPNPPKQTATPVSGSFCIKCGAKNNAEAVYCQKCGQSLTS